jgi:20S proteasome subunit alpha 6
LRKTPNPLASYTKKLQKIDEHMGVGLSGLTADGRSLVKYMRTEALNHKFVYGTPIQGGRLVVDLADMHQRCTQTYVRRPYGCGLLVACVDQTGPHLYTTEPSGDYYEYHAMAIGARSQTSKTYLEKEFESFADASRDDLIKHALKALAASLSSDVELDAKSASIMVIGMGEKCCSFEEDALQPYLDEIEVDGEGDMDTDVVIENPEI